MTLRRSQLFVPGNDERKIRKSAALNCDSIIFDLEDAVPQENKQSARLLLNKLFGELDFGRKEICVRINPITSSYFEEDVSWVMDQDNVSTVVVPKAEERLSEIRNKCGKNLMPLVETARGFLRVEEMTRSEGVVAVAYGAADFANTVGGSIEAYTGNAYVKTQIAIVASALGVDPIDNVYFGIKDLVGFKAEATLSRNLGYVGKQVIHPSQIELANEIFSPSQEEIKRAERIVSAYEDAVKAGRGALRMDEELIDAVNYRWAKLLLEKRDLIDSSTENPKAK